MHLTLSKAWEQSDMGFPRSPFIGVKSKNQIRTKNDKKTLPPKGEDLNSLRKMLILPFIASINI